MTIDRTRILETDRSLSTALGISTGTVKGRQQEMADNAVNGIVPFYGSHPTEVGRRGIDWSGQHHPHNQWPAQLNRFFYLPPLAACYAETGEARYAEAAYDFLDDWIDAHPVREGWQIAPYDNTLNLPIRVKHWVECLPKLLDSPLVTDAFLDKLCASITTQLNWLMGHVKGRGNWYIAQAEALLLAGIRLDFLPDAPAWRTRGVKILNEAFRRQVLPDGAHIERNPGYHGWMRRVFETYWRLGKVMPELGLIMTAEPVARMWDYTLAATRPNGQECAIHDGRGNHTGTRDPDWLKARSAFLREAGLPDDLPSTGQFFPDAAQAFLRDSWEEDAVYLTFDASPLESAHWHADRNAIQLDAYGRSLIIDPGTFTYDGNDPFQGYGTSTRAHSTVNFNGWDQTWSTQKIEYRQAPGYDLVHSLYDGGYWKGGHRGGWFTAGHGEGFHGAHHRTLLWIRGRAIVVLDHLYHPTGKADHVSMESVWQLSPGAVTLDAAGRRAFTGHDDGNVLMLFPLMPEGARLAVHEGETDPLRGWSYGDLVTRTYHPAPQVVMHLDAVTAWNSDLATVLLPFPGAGMPAVTAEAAGAVDEHNVASLTLRWGDGSTDEVIWYRRLARAIFLHPAIDTDACLVHLHKGADGKLIKGLAVDATYCEPYTTGARAQLETFTF